MEDCLEKTLFAPRKILKNDSISRRGGIALLNCMSPWFRINRHNIAQRKSDTDAN